jgi:hypothetical protein
MSCLMYFQRSSFPRPTLRLNLAVRLRAISLLAYVTFASFHMNKKAFWRLTVIAAQLDFGVSLGTNSIITGTFFMNIDLSATAELQFKASTERAAKAESVTPAPSASPAAAVTRRSISANGCVDVSVGADINAGVTGSIPNVISHTQSFSLFSKSETLFSVHHVIFVYLFSCANGNL